MTNTNPARDVEVVVLKYISHWVGGRGSVIYTGSGTAEGPDFQINYADSRTAVGEIGWHEEPAEAEAWSNLIRQTEPHQIQLRSGSGFWGVSVKRGAHIKRLYQAVPLLVDQLEAVNLRELNIHGSWSRTEMADFARSADIKRIHKMSHSDRDVAVFLFEGKGGVVSTESNDLVPWIKDLLLSQDYLDSWQKLEPFNTDEKHVFIMTGGRTPFQQDELLGRIDASLPNIPAELPGSLTDIWMISRFGARRALHFNLKTGWEWVEVE